MESEIRMTIQATQTNQAQQPNKRGSDLFLPNPLIRHGDVQTLLTMLKPQGAFSVVRHEQPLLLDGGYDHTGVTPDQAVRLLAYYTPQQSQGARRGLVLMLHGWEGCSHSNYNLLIGSALVEAGYDVVRLNYRDHGNTHHLNQGIFYSTLIEEVQTVAEGVAHWAGDQPFYVVGASLGGNFALRLATRWQTAHLPPLRRVIAINPAINPINTSHTLDRLPLYRDYFRKRWLASLRRKAVLFPDLYDFSAMPQTSALRPLTDWLVKHYSPYADADDYFASYAVTAEHLAALAVPTTIITAANDPIIPVEDFRQLPPHPLLDVQIHPSGGHVGYAELFPLRYALPGYVLRTLAHAEPTPLFVESSSAVLQSALA